MVEMTNGEMNHSVKEEDVEAFKAAGWTVVEKPKRKRKEQ